MSVTLDEVRYIARLARLRFDAGEEVALAEQMSQILDYVSQLDEVDTTDVAPLAHVLDQVNVTRPNVAETRITREDALKNAPDTDGTFFRVPKVID
ncbi:MAG: Asp-tRNA(Asn)/Glu-tRNA(Gln) amidotransferase subunit GatC [Bacteroidota bacterium]